MQPKLIQTTISVLVIALLNGASAKRWFERGPDEPGPGFDERHLFWLTNDNVFPPVDGWIKYEDPYEPVSGFQRRVLFFGMKGHGKSVVANYLIGNAPIAWPYSKPGTYFETRPGIRNMTGYLGRLKEDLNPIRMVEMPGLDAGQTYSAAKRREIISFLKTRDDFFHIFCWVKNQSQPRFTRADAEMFDLLEGVYGPGMFNNMLIVLAGYNFSYPSEAAREPWDDFRGKKRSLLQSMFPSSHHSKLPQIPISGLDPFCDIFDYPQYHNFVIERNSMELAMVLFTKTPVLRKDFGTEMLKKYTAERDKMTKKLTSTKNKKEESKLQDSLEKVQEKIRKLEYSMRGPKWRDTMVTIPKSASDKEL